LSEYTPGDPAGYPFVALDQVGKFAIPAFMFIAGYFIAYATSGGKRDLRWPIIRARLENLLWPWLIWSGIMLVGQSFQGDPLSLEQYLRDLFIQYYFIPLLIFYYLLAPWVVKAARKNTRSLLIGAAVTQLLVVALFYARVYQSDFPNTFRLWVDQSPLQYLRFAFYFPFGVVCGMYPRMIKTPLARFKTRLPWLTLFLFGLAFLETLRAYNTGGDLWPIGGDQTKLSSALFSTSLLLCFVAYDRLKVPYNRTINNLGAHSYGLYLCHYVILGILAKIITRLVPWITTQGWLFLPLLFVLTVALSMLLMQSAARLPTKRLYRYVFG
jgi:surface polysaccharide O-acyltransferase-like enzyme